LTAAKRTGDAAANDDQVERPGEVSTLAESGISQRLG